MATTPRIKKRSYLGVAAVEVIRSAIKILGACTLNRILRIPDYSD